MGTSGIHSAFRSSSERDESTFIRAKHCNKSKMGLADKINESHLLNVGAVALTTYGMQQLVAPKWSHEFYFEPGVQMNKNWQQWCGLVCVNCGMIQAANACTKDGAKPSKLVMQTTGTCFLSATGM